MVDGVIGVNGKLAQLAAEEDTKIGLDYVIARCRNLKEKIVQLMEHCDMRFRNAMKIRVQVSRNYFRPSLQSKKVPIVFMILL